MRPPLGTGAPITLDSTGATRDSATITLAERPIHTATIRPPAWPDNGSALSRQHLLPNAHPRRSEAVDRQQNRQREKTEGRPVDHRHVHFQKAQSVRQPVEKDGQVERYHEVRSPPNPGYIRTRPGQPPFRSSEKQYPGVHRQKKRHEQPAR